jgi:hypothetical protein
MSAPQVHASAIAFQLAAALEAYEAEVSTMLARPMDPPAYQQVSRRMDEMRMYAATLPSVSVAWVELLIRHFELTHALWRSQRDGPNAPDLEPLREQVHAAVVQLSRKCAQLLPQA